MNLLHLSKLTSHKSVSEMSTQELMDHMASVRTLRLLPRPTASSKKAASLEGDAPSTPKKSKPRAPKMPDPSKMSQADIEKLLAQLGG